jgi:hypothetical protein
VRGREELLAVLFNHSDFVTVGELSSIGSGGVTSR